MPTSTVEDYLKSILRLHDQPDAEPTVGGIAEDLGVTPGTVSSMMRHLGEEGLIDYIPRRSVALLPAGRKQALKVVRRHRLIETFLVTIMKVDWSEVHDEAEILEHVISDRLLQRMDEMLGHPSHDPHGDPIPDADGNVVSRETRSLSEASPGLWRIVRVSDADPEFLDWLRLHHLMPGHEVTILERDRLAGVLEMQTLPGEELVRLGEKAAASVLVESAA